MASIGSRLRALLPATAGRIATWLGLLAVVLAGSLLPAGLAPDEVGPMVWNFVHLPAYLALTLATLWLLRVRPGGLNGVMLAVAVAMLALGTGLEAVQPLVGRYADWRDVLVNAAGIALAVSFWRLGAIRAGQRDGERSALPGRGRGK